MLINTNVPTALLEWQFVANVVSTVVEGFLVAFAVAAGDASSFDFSTIAGETK